jgi:hypothetical protein
MFIIQQPRQLIPGYSLKQRLHTWVRRIFFAVEFYEVILSFAVNESGHSSFVGWSRLITIGVSVTVNRVINFPSGDNSRTLQPPVPQEIMTIQSNKYFFLLVII